MDKASVDVSISARCPISYYARLELEGRSPSNKPPLPGGKGKGWGVADIITLVKNR
jgi:hypothetical protein